MIAIITSMIILKDWRRCISVISWNERFHDARHLSRLRAVKFARITRSKYQASE